MKKLTYLITLLLFAAIAWLMTVYYTNVSYLVSQTFDTAQSVWAIFIIRAVFIVLLIAAYFARNLLKPETLSDLIAELLLYVLIPLFLVQSVWVFNPTLGALVVKLSVIGNAILQVSMNTGTYFTLPIALALIHLIEFIKERRDADNF